MKKFVVVWYEKKKNGAYKMFEKEFEGIKEAVELFAVLSALNTIHGLKLKCCNT